MAQWQCGSTAVWASDCLWEGFEQGYGGGGPGCASRDAQQGQAQSSTGAGRVCAQGHAQWWEIPQIPQAVGATAYILPAAVLTMSGSAPKSPPLGLEGATERQGNVSFGCSCLLPGHDPQGDT